MERSDRGLREALGADHQRLDRALSRALRDDGTVDEFSWNEFRKGLLRHIAIEERVLLPLLRSRDQETEADRQLHRDHAALAALLVPPPGPGEMQSIQRILEAHNPLEEGADGLYERVEVAAGDHLAELLQRVDAVAPVPLSPQADTPVVRRSIAKLLAEAAAGRRRLG